MKERRETDAIAGLGVPMGYCARIVSRVLLPSNDLMILFISFCLPSTSEKNTLDQEKNVEKMFLLSLFKKKRKFVCFLLYLIMIAVAFMCHVSQTILVRAVD
jgi:hypothetical protein